MDGPAEASYHRYVRSRPHAWPLLLLAFTMCPGISRHELACEEAKAHLMACCPGFSGAMLSCDDTSDELMGCDDVGLDLADARCLTGRSCEVLVESGACARAEASLDTLPTTSPWTPVCLP